MQKPTEGRGLPTDCWYRVHLSVDRDERPSNQFGVTCGQYVKSPRRSWLSRPDLPLQPDFSWCWVGSENFSLSADQTNAASSNTSSHHHALNPVTRDRDIYTSDLVVNQFKGLRHDALNSYYGMRRWLDPQWEKNFLSVYGIDVNPALWRIWVVSNL